MMRNRFRLLTRMFVPLILFMAHAAWGDEERVPAPCQEAQFRAVLDLLQAPGNATQVTSLQYLPNREGLSIPQDNGRKILVRTPIKTPQRLQLELCPLSVWRNLIDETEWAALEVNPITELPPDLSVFLIEEKLGLAPGAPTLSPLGGSINIANCDQHCQTLIPRLNLLARAGYNMRQLNALSMNLVITEQLIRYYASAHEQGLWIIIPKDMVKDAPKIAWEALDEDTMIMRAVPGNWGALTSRLSALRGNPNTQVIPSWFFEAKDGALQPSGLMERFGNGTATLLQLYAQAVKKKRLRFSRFEVLRSPDISDEGLTRTIVGKIIDPAFNPDAFALPSTPLSKNSGNLEELAKNLRKLDKDLIFPEELEPSVISVLRIWKLLEAYHSVSEAERDKAVAGRPVAAPPHGASPSASADETPIMPQPQTSREILVTARTLARQNSWIIARVGAEEIIQKTPIKKGVMTALVREGSTITERHYSVKRESSQQQAGGTITTLNVLTEVDAAGNPKSTTQPLIRIPLPEKPK